MSDFVIYLKLKPFIRQYLIHSFGDPVRFDDHSVANARIVSMITPWRMPESLVYCRNVIRGLLLKRLAMV